MESRTHKEMLEEGLGEYKGIGFHDIRNLKQGSIKRDASLATSDYIDLSRVSENEVKSIANMSSIKP